MPETETVQISTDLEVEIEHVKPVGASGARIDIEASDGRKWRVDVTRSGNVDVVTTWRDGELTDLELPEWIDYVTARIGQAA